MKPNVYIAAWEVLSDNELVTLDSYVVNHLNGNVIYKLSEKPDIILYGGGVDLNPRLYGKKLLETGQKPYDLRDGQEVFVYQYSQLFMENTPLSIGICRGGQFLNVMQGGTLEQHITGHELYGGCDDDGSGLPDSHQVEYFGPNKKDTFGMWVNSLHHQRMVPPANGREKHSPYDVLVKTIGKDPSLEALWFPETRCICVQWHPEYDPTGHSGKLMERILEDYGSP